MVSAALVIFIVLAIILLFVNMILSSMAAGNAQKSRDLCVKNCYKYSTWSAVISGICLAILLVVTGGYIYSSRKTIASKASGKMTSIGGKLSKYA